jgi:hypothetical protein
LTELNELTESSELVRKVPQGLRLQLQLAIIQSPLPRQMAAVNYCRQLRCKTNAAKWANKAGQADIKARFLHVVDRHWQQRCSTADSSSEMNGTLGKQHSRAKQTASE